jgi:hypothetical protein
MLNYGDAIAHLHIARRVFDSHRPGISQLGSVWLPLPHVLMIPFVSIYGWWANGLAGLIPSACVWLASCAGIYRLMRRWLTLGPAVIGLAFFAANPNLLYMQTTAMTEPLFLCEMVWTTLWLVEWRASLDHVEQQRRLQRLTWLVAAGLISAVFTRYDGWIMALLAWTAMGIALLKGGRLRSRAFWLASACVVAAPLAWFLYNAIVFGDWLDFARGPYSAMAIELRTATPGSGPPHPGWHNPWVSLIFFAKAAEMDAAALKWGNALLVLSAAGFAWSWLIARRRAIAWTWLLWLPLPFYAYSVAFSSVPIFLPVWWPDSYYNTRYGLEMLPAFALALAFFASFCVAAARQLGSRPVRLTVAAMLAFVLANALLVLREDPIVYVEGTKNIQSRIAYDRQIPPALHAAIASRPGAAVLMNTSVYPELVAFSGIPLRQTINESDKEYYQAALAAPAQHAAVVLAFEGDEIAGAVASHPQGLRETARFQTPGQPPATLYVSNAAAAHN